MKTIHLQYGDRIIAVVPEHCRGPGWQNSPLWVHISTNDGRYRSECIQPDEQTDAMRTLFDIGAQVHCKLLDQIKVTRAKRPAPSL